VKYLLRAVNYAHVFFYLGGGGGGGEFKGVKRFGKDLVV